MAQKNLGLFFNIVKKWRTKVSRLQIFPKLKKHTCCCCCYRPSFLSLSHSSLSLPNSLTHKRKNRKRGFFIFSQFQLFSFFQQRQPFPDFLSSFYQRSLLKLEHNGEREKQNDNSGDCKSRIFLTSKSFSQLKTLVLENFPGCK